ncbi:hypothetical protein YSY43_22050 [Paenibacillus sp. YSY-4.3]
MQEKSLSLDVKRGILVSLYEAADNASVEQTSLLAMLNPLIEEFHNKATEAAKRQMEIEKLRSTFTLIEDRIYSELRNLKS